MVDGISTVKWHNAQFCNLQEALKDDTEVKSDSWICPDVQNIEVYNNPLTYRSNNGTSFNLVVQTCFDAKRIDEANGFISYNPDYTNCQDAATEEYETTVGQMNFRSKIRSQDIETPTVFE